MARTHRRNGKRGAALPDVPPLSAVPRAPRGKVMVIGGNENKDGHRSILEHLAKQVGRGKLVVATLASEEPQAQWAEYHKVFGELGVRRIEQLDARRREELLDPG